jgi:hypothetical protein
MSKAWQSVVTEQSEFVVIMSSNIRCVALNVNVIYLGFTRYYSVIGCHSYTCKVSSNSYTCEVSSNSYTCEVSHFAVQILGGFIDVLVLTCKQMQYSIDVRD